MFKTINITKNISIEFFIKKFIHSFIFIGITYDSFFYDIFSFTFCNIGFKIRRLSEKKQAAWDKAMEELVTWEDWEDEEW